MRLDRFLAQSLPERLGLSRTRLARMIEQGAVEVDRRPATTRDMSLSAGQEVSLALTTEPAPAPESVHESAHESVASSSPSLEILYEDAHLLCFVKPAGLTTHPAPSVSGETLVERLIAHCAPTLAGYPHDPRCGIVHRLDRDTSGVMVAAKTEQARLKLARMFARHDLERRYLALVWGVPSPRAGTIDAVLARHPTRRAKMAVRRDRKQGKGRDAVTHYRVVESFGAEACLLECKLETGRTHQIRAHLSSIGHHVMGDPLYGDNNPSPQRSALAETLPAMERQALHAEHLSFSHPISDEPLSFSAQPPSDFQKLFESLRSHTRSV